MGEEAGWVVGIVEVDYVETQLTGRDVNLLGDCGGYEGVNLRGEDNVAATR